MAIWHVAPLRFAPAFRALGVCEHIWLRYKNFDLSCFDPIQKIWYVDLRTNSDFRSRSFDLLPPTLANPGIAAEDAEELKTAKYVCLTDKGYIFQPLAFEIQGGVRPSTSTFLKNLCQKLCVFNQESRAGSRFSGRDSRNPGRQCGQCSWNGSGPRPLKRTLLLVNLCSRTVLFNI